MNVRVAYPRVLSAGILAGLLLLGVPSCGTAGKGAGTSVASLSESVWRYGQDHPDGFTLDIRTMESPSEGVSVAYEATQGTHRRRDIPKVIRHALSHEGFVGGWMEAGTGDYFYDSVRLFPEDSLDAALDFARMNRQKAVYVLSEEREIAIEGKATDPAVAPDTLIILYDGSVGKEPLLEAVRRCGADVLYDYSIITGLAVRLPEGMDLTEATSFFLKVEGVLSVERDRIYQLPAPVTPSLERE